MSEKMSMAELLETYDATERISKGDILTGEILSVNADEIIVNIGYMADGLVPKTEWSEGFDAEYQVGNTIKVMVIKADDGEGNVLLSIKQAESILVWDELNTYYAQQTAFDVKVKEVVKGGVVAHYKGARIFIPASQLSLQYVESLDAYQGATLKVKLHEYDPSKKKCVASHKDILKLKADDDKRIELSRLSEGDVLQGTVVRLADYGAFVNLGTLDGLVHVSQMSWRRVKHPSEVVKVGDVVEVSVLHVDREKEKVSLKLTQVQENPWDDIFNKYQIDQVCEGTVVRLMPFGAFVELEEGLEGLVHVSEMADYHVNKPSEVVKIGEKVQVRILDIQSEQEKIALSLKGVEDNDFEDDFVEASEETPTTLSDVFGDKLNQLKF